MAGSDPARALLASPVRRRILDVLSSTERLGPDRLGGEGLTAAQLAKQLSLHVTTVRFHLDQLVAGGLVQASFHKHIGAGRPRKVYVRVTPPRQPASSPQSLLLLSRLLTDAFAAQSRTQRPLSPEEAGRRWAEENVPAASGDSAATPGQWIAKLGLAIDVLSEWGYDPEITADAAAREARIELTHCPFRELARQNPAVVCGIHQGLIAGTLARLGEPETTVDLHPFAEGERCIAHLHSPTHGADAADSRADSALVDNAPVDSAAADGALDSPAPLTPHHPDPLGTTKETR